MSDDNNSGLTRRRVLGGIATVGAASAAAGAGTMAYFSDSETATENTVTAGTLDLTIDGSDGVSGKLNVPEAKPGDSGTVTFELQNQGSVHGNIWAKVTDVRGSENSVNDAEAASNQEDNVEGAGDADSGELKDELMLAIYIDSGENGSYDNSDPQLNADGSIVNPTGSAGRPQQQNLTYSAASSYEGVSWDTGVTVNSGATVHVFWEIPESVGNHIQSDSATVDFKFRAEQE